MSRYSTRRGFSLFDGLLAIAFVGAGSFIVASWEPVAPVQAIEPKALPAAPAPQQKSPTQSVTGPPGVPWSGPGWYVSHSGTCFTPSCPYLITTKPADTVFFCPGGPYPSESSALAAAHTAGYFVSLP